MLRTCVRSSRLSLYARTQRLTENAPYKGLWLVVKTTTNQPHSVKCRKAALASIHPNSQNGNQGEMAVIRPFICLLPFWEQAKSEGQNDPLKTGRAVHTGQLARSKSAERCGSPAATSKGHWPFEAPTEPTGETSSLRRSRTAVLPSGCDALRHILLGIIWRIAGGRFAASLHRVAPTPRTALSV